MADFGYIISLCHLLITVSEIATSDVTVKTNIGYLTGFRNDVEVDGTVRPIVKFLGIPYAEPPVGLWRFRPPRPKAPSVGHLKVQEFGSRCFEIRLLSPVGTTGSEDCLYLNVYAPDKMAMESLAVMIYIHGGSFVQGSSQEYNADILAAFGHTIIVTINYRLNVWGFLSTEDHNAYGNYGLWDQQLAIQWVRDNIEAFGGDKDRITIFGESAGGASVIHQGLYPGNKGLFQRIIAQSGSASAAFALNANPKRSAEKLAKALGCFNESVATMVDCLRYLPANTIHSIVNQIGFDLSFSPSVDNIFVTCNPADVLKMDVNANYFQAARDTFASFDLMMGINSREGVLFMLPTYGYGNPETFLPNKTHFDKVMVPILVNFVYGEAVDMAIAKAIANAIIVAYTDTEDPENPYRIREQFIAMQGDSYFLAPMQTAISVHAKLTSKMTYMYYFSVNPPFHVLPTPSWVEGANHGDEILYVFPSELYPFDGQNAALAAQMVGMWTNFAKTGNPNQPVDVRVQWTPYTESRHVYLDITTNMTSANLKQGLQEDRAAFWNRDVPEIIGGAITICDYHYDTADAPGLFNAFLTMTLTFFVRLMLN